MMFWKGTLLLEPREKPANSHHPLVYTSPLTDTNLYPSSHSASFFVPDSFFHLSIFIFFPFFLQSTFQSLASTPLVAICCSDHLFQFGSAHCFTDCNTSIARTLLQSSMHGHVQISLGRAHTLVDFHTTSMGSKSLRPLSHSSNEEIFSNFSTQLYLP